MKHILFAVAIFALAPLFANAQDAEVKGRPQPIPDSIHGPLVAGDLDGALDALEAVQKTKAQKDGTWRYLTALTLARADRKLEAVNLLEALELDLPNGTWSSKSRFTRADLLGDLGRHAEAQAILDQEATRLRSPERRADLAEACFLVADALSEVPTGEPSDQLPASQVSAVLNVLDEILELDVSSKVQLRVYAYKAAVLTQPEHLSLAVDVRNHWVQIADQLLQTSPDADLELERISMRLDLARALVEYDPSTAILKLDLLAKDLVSEPVASLLGKKQSRLQGDVELLRAKVESLNLFATQGDGRIKATKILRTYLTTYPEHPARSQAAFDIGLHFNNAGHSEDAVAAWKIFLASPEPQGEADGSLKSLELDALLRMSASWRIGDTLMGMKKFQEAIEVFRTYIQHFPSGPDWAASQRAIVDAQYSIGKTAYDDGDYPAARKAWSEFLAANPISTRSANVSYLSADSFAKEALTKDKTAKSPESIALFQSALKAFENVAKKNPGSDDASLSLFRMGQIYEDRLLDLATAIETFRLCTFGASFWDAQTRLADMLEESLQIRTPGTIRSTEVPSIEVTTRNLEELKIELYALDLEAYFRRHKTHRSVENLDLDLIQADKSFLHKPAPGSKHERLIETVPLPIDGPGVWVVTAVSGKRRATTLVMVSDIDLIIESTAMEAVLFAQNMVQAEAAPGTRLVLLLDPAPGSTEATVLEAETGKDGIAHIQFPHPSNSLAVLGVLGAHRASEGISFDRVMPKALTRDTSFLYTERSTYRPGETMYWRGVLRTTDSHGSYTFQAGRPYDVAILDHTGRILSVTSQELGPMGTLHGEFGLSLEATFGAYTLQITDPKRSELNHSIRFSVDRFAVPNARLVATPRRSTVLRGDSIEIDIKASYSHGVPIVNSPISITISGREQNQYRELKTDNEGKAVLHLDGSELLGADSLFCAMTLSEENAECDTRVYIASEAFSASVSTNQEVFLAGETFAVTLKTTGIDGLPTPREMKLRVLRHEQDVQGRVLEVLVDERTVSTDNEAIPGEGTVSLRLEKGGDYTLRAEGIDENQNPIQASVPIFLSDESDQVRLRFFPERIQYEVGEMASLRLHNRSGDKLALVLLEGGGVLNYSLQKLAPGDNKIEFLVEPEHFSRVYASVSLMDGAKLQRARQYINVRHNLTVEVASSTEVALPGEPIEITITTRDGLGSPVPAEFSLAMVDDLYFDLYRDVTGSIATPFTAKGSRDPYLQATTTCDFSYEGVTGTISSAILEEEERLDKEKSFEKRLGDAKDLLGKLGYTEGAGSDSPFEQDSSPMTLWKLGATATPSPGSPAPNELLGIGGGAGGKFGGRSGGSRALRARAGLVRGTQGFANLESATKYWNPNGKTGADGKLTLTIPMPSEGGTWRFLSRAVGDDTRLGQGLLRVETSAPFLVELLTPEKVRKGDSFEARARVHYEGKAPGTAYLTLNVGGIADSELRERALTLDGSGSATISLGEFSTGDKPGLLRFDLEARWEATPGSDLGAPIATVFASKLVDIIPFGIVVQSAEGGHLADTMDVRLSLPSGDELTDVKLELFVGGGIGAELISAALGRSPFGTTPRQANSSRADRAGELMGVLSVLEWLREAEPTSRDLYTLSLRAQSLSDALSASATRDGLWEWTTKGSGPLMATQQPQRQSYSSAVSGSLETTVFSLLALKRASLSFPLPDRVLRDGAGSLLAMFRTLSSGDLEHKAIALHGLSAVGAADFADVNRLVRARSELSPAALAHLVLALVELDRMELASDLAGSLSALARPTTLPTPRCVWPLESGPAKNSGWARDESYMNGLALWALSRSLPDSPQLALAAEGLLASAPWGSNRSRGVILSALTSYGAEALPEQGAFEVEATIAGHAPVKLQVTRGSTNASMIVHLDNQKAGEEIRIHLQLVGDARTGKSGFAPTYHALLSGLSAGANAQTTEGMFTPHVTYRTLPPLLNGRRVDTGFDVLSFDARSAGLVEWMNTTEQLPRGARCEVTVVLERDFAQELEVANFLEIELPLPPGAAVVPGTLAGTVDSYRTMDGGLILTLQGGSPSHRVSFELIGVDKGHYVLPPTVVRATADPSRVGYGPSKSLEVLDSSQVSADVYRQTPDELFATGQSRYQENDYPEARELLTKLFVQFDGKLFPEIQGKVAAMLLDSAIRYKDSAGTVMYFENLKEYDPSLFLTLEEVLAIGRAYRDLGEHERASTMFLATISETFHRDMRVAGVLENHGAFLTMSAMLDRLWREYPDLPDVVATRLSHSDALLNKAKTAHQDPTLRALGLDQIAFTMDSIMLLREFMALYPDHVLSSSAGLNLVSAYLELEDYGNVAALAGRLGEHFTEPKIRDDFRYTRAVASWYEGRPSDAVDLLRGIADAVYTDERGAESKSINKNLALYLLAQIHHASGELDVASRFYGMVKQFFPDAMDLFHELEESRLEINEVTEVLPGAKINLPLRFKGVTEVELSLYPVDLMTLYLREGDLESVAKVNLAGIAPVAKETFQLEPLKGLKVGETVLKLPKLAKGAYLAMARSQGLFTSGLVLVTDLELLVRENGPQGQVRTQVTRVDEDGYLADVEIRVVGSQDGRIQTGKTDKRGLFVTSGVNGTSTVIARFGEREYAFHRGAEALGLQPGQAEPMNWDKNGPSDGQNPSSFMSNVLGQNEADQGSRMQELQSNMKRTSKGVQVQTLP